MSFMDKLKSMFSGGSESSDTPASAHEPAEMPADAPYVPPAAPADPMGAPIPDPEPGAGTEDDRPQ